MNKDYSNHNAEEVLKYVNLYIGHIEAGNFKRFRIRDVAYELSIFGWWNDYLSKSQLMDMRKFLNEAIKLGYTGYVCFKVGATGCANGMWANKEESTNGFSPKGECLYKSFTPEYNYWAVSNGLEFYPQGKEYDSVTTIAGIEKVVENLNKYRERATEELISAIVDELKDEPYELSTIKMLVRVSSKVATVYFSHEEQTNIVEECAKRLFDPIVEVA